MNGSPIVTPALRRRTELLWPARVFASDGGIKPSRRDQSVVLNRLVPEWSQSTPSAHSGKSAGFPETGIRDRETSPAIPGELQFEQASVVDNQLRTASRRVSL
jgi:hypothetical protein